MPSNSWDSELVVVSAATRSALRSRIVDLRAAVDRDRSIALADLAYTVNMAIDPAQERLGIVARSIEDLSGLLDRAAARLGDEACREIHDAAGIYYTDQPLAREGGLAFLFPGEGAQYVGMLGDVADAFPEVRARVEWCDAIIARASPETRSPSEFMFVPPGLVPGDRQALESDMRRLSDAMFSVLAADWAMLGLLDAMGLEADAMAGHSAGEVAALCCAGCIDADMNLGRLPAAIRGIESRENGQSGGAVLLAVGGRREVVADVLRETVDRADLALGEPQAFLAMDNCPHQSVLVGTPVVMDRVEQALRDRRMVCERLALGRPYHTPLFARSMAPLEAVFDAAGFKPPRMTVYCCTTGEPFPDDPWEIRRLMLEHWRAPVEFSRMIERMHRDGIRLFVEAGPRGNLTAFVDDILRGRRFLAIPANLARRSGITQVHHLAAQLAAHHVPIRLDVLYRHREVKRIEWQVSGERARVVSEHFRVMERFLGTQRAVMEQFFLSRGRARRVTETGSGSFDPSSVRRGSPRIRRGSAGPAIEPAFGPWPLVGEVVRHEAGRELVTRRLLDPREDLFAGQHTVGGREASKVDPGQHGLPIMPMTFDLEIMAEMATILVPGKVVLGVERVQLYRWLAYDEADLSTIEAIARLQPAPRDGRNPGVVARVRVEIRDLRKSNGSPSVKPGPAAVGTVLLGNRYPAAPLAAEFSLTRSHPCPISLEALYKYMFHGPRFQGMLSLGMSGDDGIEARVRALPRDGLFRGNPWPQFLLDPVLSDVFTHPLCGWHLEQADQAGRILLPYELEFIHVYGPAPEVGTEFTVRGRIVVQSTRRYVHGIEAIDRAGRVYCTLRVKYWRFYLPFGKYNFHGPKDEYFLSHDWPAALPEISTGERTRSGANVAGTLRVPDSPHTECAVHIPTPPVAWCMRLSPPADLKQPAMQRAGARVTLSPRELEAFYRLKDEPARSAQWLFGRIIAKDAVRSLWREHHGERWFPADVEIDEDARGRLTARPRNGGAEQFPNVCVAESAGVFAALASFRSGIGIELASLQPLPDDFELAGSDATEQSLLGCFGPNREEAAVRFWCAKRAVEKALRQGRGELGRPSQAVSDGPERPPYLAVRWSDASAEELHVEVGPGPGMESPHGEPVRYRVKTLCDQGLIVATTLCERVDG